MNRRGRTCTDNPFVPNEVLTLLSCTAEERDWRSGWGDSHPRPLRPRRSALLLSHIPLTDRRGLAPHTLAGTIRFRGDAGWLLRLTIQIPTRGVAPRRPPHEGGAVTRRTSGNAHAETCTRSVSLPRRCSTA